MLKALLTTSLKHAVVSIAAGLPLACSVVTQAEPPRGTDGAAPPARPRIATRTAEEEVAPNHALQPALKLARTARDNAAQLTDYTATFSKRELVGQALIGHTMDVKFRPAPFSVYMRFRKANEGREVLFVEGRNGGKLMAREPGFKGIVGTVSLLPTSPNAMSEGRYPITLFGMENLANGVVTMWENELKHEDPEVKYYPNAKFGGMECQVVESVHPTPKRHFPFHRTRLYIDKSTGLPVRVEQNGFPSRAGSQPPVIEEYSYTNIKTNVKLTERDFDSRNPNYGF